MKKFASLSVIIAIACIAISFKGSVLRRPVDRNDGPSITPPNDTIQYPEEKHFKNVIQLTFGGDNAEAYWSFDSKYIVFQRTNPKEGINCDQIFMGKAPQKPGDKFEYKAISS